MADVYLAIQSDKPGSSLVLLVNGEPSVTGYTIPRSGGVDLGAAVYDKVYSGPRGTQGAKLVGATAQNRLSTWMLQVAGTSEDDLQAKMSVLWNLDEELRAYGGTAYWRSWGSSFRMELDVLDSGIQVASFDPDLWVANHRLNVQLGLVTPPYMSGPPMDVVDDFSSDTTMNYTFDAGSVSDVAITGGQLTAVANLTTEKRMIHTGVGYSYGDVQATVKAIPGSTITSYLAGVVLKRIDVNNYIRVYVDDNGVNSRLRIDVVVAGVLTNRNTTNLASRVSSGTSYWVRGRIEGSTVFAEFFTSADWLSVINRRTPYTGPTPMQGPTSSVNYTLSTGEQTTLGELVTGQAGLNWIPQQSAAVLDDFVIAPYTYRSVSTPDNLVLRGSIPGDAPALVEANITPSGGAAAPIWAAFGWWPQVGSWNRVWNGDFENTVLVSGGVPLGWSNAAVTNINGAATSVARITNASKYGTCSGQIVCPATSGTGANFRIFRRFRKGITYTAECWIHSGAGVTSTSIRLGNGAGADTATSGGVALSTTWTRITTTWTPTADRDDAHVAVIINAATATTFEIDGVMVYEGTVAPTSLNQSEGRGGFPPVGVIEAENNRLGFTANANFRSGFGGNNLTAQVVLDPTLLVQETHTEEIAIEVWARVETASVDSGVLIASAKPLTSTNLPSIFTEEFGSVGKIFTRPSAGTVRRFIRAGTLRLPTLGRYLLEVDAIATGQIDYLLLVPPNARALSPSGRANDTSYPDFLGATTEATRRIRSDLSGTVKETSTSAPESSASGLGGSLLEFPATAIETVVKLSSLVPDDPTSNTTDEQLAHSATVHYSVTPRWRVGRSS